MLACFSSDVLTADTEVSDRHEAMVALRAAATNAGLNMTDGYISDLPQTTLIAGYLTRGDERVGYWAITEEAHNA